MNYPIAYLLFFLTLVAGYFIGAGICMALLIPVKKHTNNRKKSKKKSSDFNAETENDDPESDDEPKTLRTRLIDKSNSWTDFNCAADCVDSEEYIKERRKTQDKAYQYVRSRLEKVKEDSCTGT